MEVKIRECIQEYLISDGGLNKGRLPDRTSETMYKRAVSMIIGNLDGLGDLRTATKWLQDKLSYLNGPSPTKTYSKWQFSGILFAEFCSETLRDSAVDILRTAAPTNGKKKVWATQDRPPAERAARNFCLGLKRVLKEHWEVRYTISVSECDPYVVTVGCEHALTAKVDDKTVHYDWQGEWKTWTDRHDHPQIREVHAKSSELLEKASKGMKGTNYKGKGKGKRGTSQADSLARPALVVDQVARTRGHDGTSVRRSTA
ncbi:unnamed protein product, partial [Prorocentrum cordatum]